MHKHLVYFVSWKQDDGAQMLDAADQLWPSPPVIGTQNSARQTAVCATAMKETEIDRYFKIKRNEFAGNESTAFAHSTQLLATVWNEVWNIDIETSMNFCHHSFQVRPMTGLKARPSRPTAPQWAAHMHVCLAIGARNSLCRALGNEISGTRSRIQV